MANTEQPPEYTETQQPQTVVSQPTVTVQPDSTGSTAAKTRSTWKTLGVTGYIQVALGISSVLLGAVAIVFRSYFYIVGYPIWVGICFYIVTGIIGVAVAGKKSSCLVIVYLTMSILTALSAAIVVIFSSMAIGNDVHICPDRGYRQPPAIGCSSSYGARIAIDVMIVIIAFGEMVTAIFAAIFTCKPLCSKKTTAYPMVYYQTAPQVIMAGQPQTMVHYAGMPQQQYVPQPQQQYVLQPHQQFVPQPQPGIYPGQQILPPQGQMQYYPMPQTAPQAMPLAQAQTVPQQPTAPATTPDQYNKPPIP